MRKPASGCEHEQGGIKKGAERPSKRLSGTELTEAHHPYWKKLDKSECTDARTPAQGTQEVPT